MGKHGPTLLIDPAIEKWASMRENSAQHFRFTRRNVVGFLISAVIVPGIIYQVVEVYNSKYIYQPAGIEKGEAVYVKREQEN